MWREKMIKNKTICSLLCLATVFVACDASAAAKSKKAATQSALKKGTDVRAKSDASGLYDQECFDAYYGCMDQFCIVDNDAGGTCGCSDLIVGYNKQLQEIQDLLVEAERVATVEVERVKAGAQEDIIFAGERKYDENGNIISSKELSESEKKAKDKQDLLALWDTSFDEEEEEEEEDIVDISEMVGAELFASAEEICLEQVPESCSGDMKLLRSMYSRQITSDCKGLENSIATKKAEADAAMAAAESDVRLALKESFEDANKYDLGQCMVNFKKCMQTDDACGKNWENCVSVVAAENMQNNKTQSTAGTTVDVVDIVDITASTMEILNSKRIICENVLEQCVKVRDMVWPAFLREAAPTIKVAEASAESKFRQSCLSDISNCIQKACKDDIVGKGVDTMDACLARPDMARSFCKVEIDPCERMEPMIWDYVTDKLAAMRVDACTEEVKACFTAENRCGENFKNCVGMDYDYIHDICPIDSLVVCKQGNPAFSMDDLDSMLMGLYLNIDNAALDNCQALVDAKMAEICGSTTDCNKFAADDTIGTNSLRSQKDGSIYRVTGMISFGSIKMGDVSGSVKDIDPENPKEEISLKPGEIGVQGYLAKVRELNQNTPNKDSIIASIEEELNNIAGTINRTIEMIEQDPEIQYCVNGRDLSQITGKDEKTAARFPNLLNQTKMQIAISALRQAQDNYNKKLNEAMMDASKNASADIAQYMCQMLPTNGGARFVGHDTPMPTLTEPYAISYEVASGLNNELLAQGGKGTSATSGTAKQTSGQDTGKVAEAIGAVLSLGLNTMQGGNRVSQELPGGTREMWSTFNRETRICHFCTSTITKNCSADHRKGFLGIGAKDQMSCEESAPIEKCEDIQM